MRGLGPFAGIDRRRNGAISAGIGRLCRTLAALAFVGMQAGFGIAPSVTSAATMDDPFPCAACDPSLLDAACLLSYGAYGTVTDSLTGEPIAGARVQVGGLPVVFTAGDGAYEANGTRASICNVNHTLSVDVRAEGFQPAMMTVLGGTASFPAQINFELDAAPLPSPTPSCTPGGNPAPGCANEGPPFTATPTPSGPVLHVEPASLPPFMCEGAFGQTATMTPTPGNIPDLVPSRLSLFAPTPIGGCLPPSGQLHPQDEVCVANRGGAASGAFNVRIQSTVVTLPDEFRMDGLAAGEERCVLRAYTPFNVDVIVDAESEVSESNEDNNHLSTFVPVLTPPPACPSPTPTSSPADTPTATRTPTEFLPTPSNTPSASPTTGNVTSGQSGSGGGCAVGGQSGSGGALVALSLAVGYVVRRRRSAQAARIGTRVPIAAVRQTPDTR